VKYITARPPANSTWIIDLFQVDEKSIRFFPFSLALYRGGKGDATLLNFDVVFSLLGFQKTFFGRLKPQSIVSLVYTRTYYYYVYKYNLGASRRMRLRRKERHALRETIYYKLFTNKHARQRQSPPPCSLTHPLPRGFVFLLIRFYPRARLTYL